MMGIVVLLIITLCPLYFSFLLVNRLGYQTPFSVRLSATGLMASGLVVLMFLITAGLKAYSWWTVTLLCLTLVITAHVKWGKHNNLTKAFDAFKNNWLSLSDRKIRAIIILLIGLVIFSVGRGLLMPPLAWDSLTYHLVFAGTWIQEHALVTFSFPDGMDGYSHFPINGEILTSWVMLPFHSDLLANVISFPFLFLGGLALYALGREFRLSREGSLLLAASVCLSPMNYAYVTTAYVDLQVFAEILCAVLFFFRFSRKGSPLDAFFMLLSISLAIGTKFTAIVFAALIGFSAFIQVLLMPWMKRIKYGMKATVIAFLLLAPIGGYQYIKNILETRNPLYPYSVSVNGHEIFKGSQYIDKVAERGLGDRRLDLRNIAFLFQYGPAYYPRTAGPKFLFFAMFAPLLIRFWRPSRIRTREVLLTGVWLLPILFYYLDGSANSVIARRYWPADSPRFIAAPLALMALSAFLVISRLRIKQRLVNWVIGLFLIGDVLVVNYSLLHPVEDVIVIFGTAAVCGLIIWLIHFWRINNHLLKSATLLIALLLFTFSLLPSLISVRNARRWEYYDEYIDLHALPKNFVEGWRWCDNPLKPQTIALTVGWKNPGHNWFIYPLMGRNLQNRVVYSSVNRNGVVPTHLDRGLLREKYDHDVWQKNIEQQKVDVLFIQEPWPIESQWTDKAPHFFKYEYGRLDFKIYRCLHNDRVNKYE